jgi:hypothetical protein
MTSTKRLAPILSAFLFSAHTAHAGRPLSTDDAGTADTKTCQVETWFERAGSERAWVVAPACGVFPGVELGADYTLPNPRDVVNAGAGLALKWVPEFAKVETRLGEVAFGVKVSTGWVKPAHSGWSSAGDSALALATLKPHDDWTVHANLGVARDKTSDVSASLLNLALVWTPHDRALVFAEIQANNKRQPFGGTIKGLGGRWWMVRDRVGLDLTASREAGVAGATQWTLGIGWYGIGAK